MPCIIIYYYLQGTITCRYLQQKKMLFPLFLLLPILTIRSTHLLFQVPGKLVFFVRSTRSNFLKHQSLFERRLVCTLQW